MVVMMMVVVMVMMAARQPTDGDGFSLGTGRHGEKRHGRDEREQDGGFHVGVGGVSFGWLK
jgi:hypothetical protein